MSEANEGSPRTPGSAPVYRCETCGEEMKTGVSTYPIGLRGYCRKCKTYQPAVYVPNMELSGASARPLE